MSRLWSAAFLLVALVPLVPGQVVWSRAALAQDIRETEAVCSDTTGLPETRITACSRLIDEAAYTDLADYAATHIRRASAYRDAGLNVSALADIDTALEYDPYLYSGYMIRGDILLGMGEAYRAISDFTVAGGLNPLEAAPYTKRGLALFANREYGEAIRSLDTALGYDPNAVEARWTLAWILSTAPDTNLRDGKRASSLVAALPDENDSAQDKIIRAAALAQSGDIDGAISLYQQIAEGESGAVTRYKQYLAANDMFDGAIDDTFTAELAAALRQCLTSGCRIGAPRS